MAGFGVVGEAATGFPGYDSIIRKDTGTIGRILTENGYATAWFGKDHNTPFYQASQAGPFDQWPVCRQNLLDKLAMELRADQVHLS